MIHLSFCCCIICNSLEYFFPSETLIASLVDRLLESPKLLCKCRSALTVFQSSKSKGSYAVWLKRSDTRDSKHSENACSKQVVNTRLCSLQQESVRCCEESLVQSQLFVFPSSVSLAG